MKRRYLGVYIINYLKAARHCQLAYAKANKVLDLLLKQYIIQGGPKKTGLFLEVCCSHIC